MKATIFNIQRYSLHDGGGIRSIVFFKGCPFHCPWCCNPESLSLDIQEMFKEHLCIACSIKDGKCINDAAHCPSKAKTFIGEHKTIEDIIDVLKRDKVFYETSNGGITLSGGEVLLQQPFAYELLQACKKEGFHTAIESTLGVQIQDAKRLVSLVDVFLIDLKIMDPKQSQHVCGINIQLVKENIRNLLALNTNIIIRIPLIPKYTTSKENIQSIIRFMQLEDLKEVHLLPYHNLGETKYNSLNLTYSLYDLEAISDKMVEDIKQMFIDANINACIHGN